ncbi:MAG: DUF4157 domain-containing protein [Bacteroidota bacterium]
MKQICLLSSMCVIFLSMTSAQNSLQVQFATKGEAQKLLSQEDAFTKSWSPFDVQSRLQDTAGTREQLFAHIQDQVLEWAPDEQEAFLTAVDEIEGEIHSNRYQVPLPDTLMLVKTTGKEEGGATAYTRGNYIVFKEGVHKMPKEDLKRLVVHELFHVLSRNFPDFRESMYRLIGFTLIKPIQYPEAIASSRITNPDAPQTDSYINLQVNGDTTPCMMVLYADKPYNGGAFFEYLQVGFWQLPLEDEVSNNEAPTIYTMKTVDGFFQQVGKNTNYIIHPEEILAENFSFALLGKEGLPDQWLVEAIQELLQK